MSINSVLALKLILKVSFIVDVSSIQTLLSDSGIKRKNKTIKINAFDLADFSLGFFNFHNLFGFILTKRRVFTRCRVEHAEGIRRRMQVSTRVYIYIYEIIHFKRV